MPVPTKCQGCGVQFPSKSALFTHLRSTEAACLSGQDYEDFLKFVKTEKQEKVAILYGYYIPPSTSQLNGEDVAQRIMKAMGSDDNNYTRSYGHSCRHTDIVAQEDQTSAITEVLSTKLPQISSVSDWISTTNDTLATAPFSVTVLGRMKMKYSRFNAEMDSTHRKMEYLLPADFLFPSNSYTKNMNEFFEMFPILYDDGNQASSEKPVGDGKALLGVLKKLMQRFTTQIAVLDTENKDAVREKELSHNKRMRQKNTPAKATRVEKAKACENVSRELHSDDDFTGHDNGSCRLDRKPKRKEQKKVNVLQRRRYHNFTPKVMAHEFLAYRRVDRISHRATLRYGESRRPFLALCLSGDLFLSGQVCRMLGLVVAVMRGLVHSDFIDCVFDEHYPHLVPTPPLPTFAMYACDADYCKTEGKAAAILTPRETSRYKDGWNDEVTIRDMDSMKAFIRENVSKTWLDDGVADNGRLVAETNWTENVLEPWARRARQQLADYRSWKIDYPAHMTEKDETMNDNVNTNANIPLLSSVNSIVPPLFEKVLSHLQDANKSGLWPSTSLKRQLVMVSQLADCDEQQVTSLSTAAIRAQSNNENRTSAYAYVEGQGGASGSFSVGYMPGDRSQPKANALFPELTKAAFELERVLRPEREPSSTIAINRNAQFRPHIDSGAGVGQGTSLIVGLGTYSGGELVIEGEQRDIRYRAIEFNGWKERHWTMPFRGERFSLVWFTPKGCEGLRGIDLDL